MNQETSVHNSDVGSENLERKLGWDINPSLWEKTKVFGKECKGNAKFEAFCIFACDLGEFVGEVISYNAQRIAEFSQDPALQSYAEFLSNNLNLTGFIGAISFGGAYAFAHTFKHGKGYPVLASTVEAAKVTVTTESACVGSASGVQASASKYIVLAATQNPLEPINLGVRAGVLPVAFGVGTLAMSSMTLAKKNEASRIVAPKGKLTEIAEALRSKGYQITCDKEGQYGAPVIRILGEDSYVDITEQNLPRIYGRNFDDKKNSMYMATGSTVRYSKDAKKDLADLTRDAFKEAGISFEVVKNPFAPHSNDHSHENNNSHTHSH